ncbi:MAG TPA: hypothetical protein VIR65_15575 [Rhizorhapis sp.]
MGRFLQRVVGQALNEQVVSAKQAPVLLAGITPGLECWYDALQCHWSSDSSPQGSGTSKMSF